MRGSKNAADSNARGPAEKGSKNANCNASPGVRGPKRATHSNARGPGVKGSKNMAASNARGPGVEGFEKGYTQQC